jgi:hypothetical protein
MSEPLVTAAELLDISKSRGFSGQAALCDLYDPNERDRP